MVLMKKELRLEFIGQFYFQKWSIINFMMQIQTKLNSQKLLGNSIAQQRRTHARQKMKQISMLKFKYLSSVTNITSNKQANISFQPLQIPQNRPSQAKPLISPQSKVQANNAIQNIIDTNKKTEQSTIVRQIIQRKLNQHTQHKLNIEDETIFEQMPLASPQVKYQVKTIVIPYDQEYYNQEQQAKPQQQQVRKRNIEQHIHLWINSPSVIVADTVTYNYQSKSTSNTSFDSNINNLIQQFVFYGKYQMNEIQMKCLYILALQYFYNNVNQLSPYFLFVLIKLGPSYLQKYSSFFQIDILNYCKEILSNKHIFQAQELSQVVNFCITNKQATQAELMHLMLICPTQKLIQLISNKTLPIEETIQFACLIRCMKSQWSKLIELYLKLLGHIIGNIEAYQHQLIEMVLKYVNQLQLDQKYYHIHKQIKLKLINILNSKQSHTHKEQDIRTNQGLFAYWNKAVSKITSTNKVQLPKQNEPNSDSLFKRYFIGSN